MYTPARLASDGFVHCSGTRALALAVAADYFADLGEPLYVLEIDPEELTHELRYEAPAPIAGMARRHLEDSSEFPHVYGPIDLSAITGAARLARNGAGRDWPQCLLSLDHWIRTDPIEVVDYDPEWRERFASERGRIAAVWGSELVEIHHVGSTSIAGAQAKPIVDVLAVVSNVARLDALDDAMVSAGYTPKGEYGIEGRRFFWKVEASVRHLHVHAFGTGHPHIDRMLRLRDYLRAHADDARAYGELKQALAARHRSDIESYTNGKNEFIESILRKAAPLR
jgi:GrpB-like predicted nucleotidyltransferase (UPF0157 family)